MLGQSVALMYGQPFDRLKNLDHHHGQQKLETIETAKFLNFTSGEG
jgi:hypothetical protein